MPIGANQTVKRFVRGHVYKVYPPKDPDRYVIVRFKYKKCHSVLEKAYVFVVVADNYHTYGIVLEEYGLTIKYCRFYYQDFTNRMNPQNVEEVRLEDLPRYLGAKTVYPEYERIFKGLPLFKRKLSKIKKP